MGPSSPITPVRCRRAAGSTGTALVGPVVGVIGVVVGAGVVVTADGGTGNGLGGGLFAGILGLVAVGLGVRLLRRPSVR